MGKYWNEEIECMAHEDMKKLQSERLVKQVKHVWDNVPYYKKLMEEKGVTPEDIHGIEDLHKLPFQKLICVRLILMVCLQSRFQSVSGYIPQAEQQASVLWLFTLSMISTCGTTAVQEL